MAKKLHRIVNRRERAMVFRLTGSSAKELGPRGTPEGEVNLWLDETQIREVHNTGPLEVELVPEPAPVAEDGEPAAPPRPDKKSSRPRRSEK